MYGPWGRRVQDNTAAASGIRCERHLVYIGEAERWGSKVHDDISIFGEEIKEVEENPQRWRSALETEGQQKQVKISGESESNRGEKVNLREEGSWRGI